MENKIYYLSFKDIIKIKKGFIKDKKLFIAEVEGSEINNLNDFFNKANMLFKFPIPIRSIDGYLDWIRDLEWLMKDKYVVIINNYKNFMSEDVINKEKIVNSFAKIVLPWWQKEVELCVVEGKAKSFNVYLVD